ncbi:MAG: DUF4097 family beta strand repeat-containing protein [Pseudobdellovibrionaceae bacterium]
MSAITTQIFILSFFQFFMWLPHSAQAQQSAAALGYQWSPSEVDSILLRSDRINLVVSTSPTDFIRATRLSADWKIEKKDRQLIFTYRAGTVAGASTSLDLALPVGKQILVQVVAGEGQILAQKGARDLKVTLQGGRVQSIGSSGTLHLYVHKGDISVQDHSGAVLVDAFQLNSSSFKNILGEGQIEVFQGTVGIEKWQGRLGLQTHKAVVQVTQSQGALQLDSNSGSFNVQTHKGRIDGSSKDGVHSINIVKGGVDVNLRTQSGKITVQSPPVAYLNVSSREGDIYLPSPLKVLRTSTEKFYRGNKGSGAGSKSGDEGFSRITLRSSEGIISIK